MRQRTALDVTPADRARLEAVAADRNSPQKHVWRAKVVLAAADGHGTAAIGRRAGLSRPSVRRWRERFAREGVAGLLRDKSNRRLSGTLRAG
jgi:transposase